MDNLEVIKAKIKDDAVVIIDRIMRCSRDNIAIVLPKNSIIAANLSSLENFKEETESISKKLFIVTVNEKIAGRAEAIGVPVYSEIEEIEIEEPEPEEEEIEAPKPVLVVKKPKGMLRMADIIAPNFSDDTVDQDEEKTPAPPLPRYDENEEEEKEFYKEEEPNAEIEPDTNENHDNEEENESNLALNLNLPTKSDLEEGVEKFYGNNVTTAAQKPLEALTINFFARLLVPKRLIVGLVVLSLFAALGSLYLILPSATIVLSTKANPISAAIPVTVSKVASSIDAVAGIIPGQFFSAAKTGSKNFTSAGNSQEAISSYASGIIHIYNAYSAAPQKLVSGTRFETKDGKIFKIKKSIIIPGAKISSGELTPSIIDVRVFAALPGEDYNVGPSYFTIPGFKGSPKYAGFYAKNTDDMSSGKIGSAKVLTQQDFDSAKKELEDELTDQLKQEIIGASQSDLTIIDGASLVKLAYVRSSAKVGAAIDSFTLDAKVDWQAIAFRKDDLAAVTASFLKNKYPDVSTDQAGSGASISNLQINWTNGEMTFLENINNNLASGIDVSSLRGAIAGKSMDEIRKVISSQPQVQNATITLWPFWVSRAPNNQNKISISIINGQ